MSKKEQTTIEDLMDTLDFFDHLGITYWLDGGWGVDVLVGEQTREHRDIDIDFDAVYIDKVVQELLDKGYQLETDWRPVRMEFYHSQYGYLDVHPFTLLKDGRAKQADLQGGWYTFEADYFCIRAFEEKLIACISAKGQKIFHSGYEWREVDYHDIKNIEKVLQASKD